MSWIPVLLIWAALLGVGAYYLREWWRIGRDPAGQAIVPHTAPPEGLSPMALFFIRRRGVADSHAINAGTLGSLAEFIRRGLVRVEDSAGGPRIVPQEDGDGAGLQPDLLHFLDHLIPRDRAAERDDLRRAASKHWLEVHRMLHNRIVAHNFVVTFSGGALLAIAALVTIVLVNWTFPPGNDGALIIGGYAATLLIVVALAMRRARTQPQRYLALGLGLSGVLVLAIVIFAIVGTVRGSAGLERALVMAGLFLVVPLVAWAWAVMMALTPEGRRLRDEVEGFRMFIRTAGASAASAGTPDPDDRDWMVPYAIALEVEGPWIGAATARLPLGAWRTDG